jgi:hypothetical protein
MQSTYYNIISNFNSNATAIWNLIRNADVNNYIMTAGTNDPDTYCNLVPGHAYSLLNTYILHNPNGTVAYQLY